MKENTELSKPHFLYYRISSENGSVQSKGGMCVAYLATEDGRSAVGVSYCHTRKELFCRAEGRIKALGSAQAALINKGDMSFDRKLTWGEFVALAGKLANDYEAKVRSNEDARLDRKIAELAARKAHNHALVLAVSARHRAKV